MKTYLKQAPPPAPQDRTRLEETVRGMLADIATNRDEAVRRYAREFDKWESGAFRVSADEIRKVSRELPESFKADFEYSLKQVVGFARRQLETLSGFETEIEPGIVLGQKMIPVERVGCYVPGGKFPLVASAIMSVGTAKAAAGLARRRVRAAARRERHVSVHALRPAPRGRGRDLQPRRRTGDGGDDLRLRRHSARRHDHRRRQPVRGRGEAPALRHRRHRSPRRSDRDPGDRRRLRGPGAGRDRPPRPGGARPGQPGLARHHLARARRGGAGGGRAPARDPADAEDRGAGLARSRRDRGGGLRRRGDRGRPTRTPPSISR